MRVVRVLATTGLSLLAVMSIKEAAAAAKPGDTSQSPSNITVPFTSTAPTGIYADYYVLCFEADASRTDCGGKKHLPAEVGVGPLKAGKKLLVVLSGDCSNRDLYLQKQPITPTDANPVRGASPAKNTVAGLRVGLDGGAATRCYALYPDPLTSDTYTTVHIAKKDPPKGKDAKEVDISDQPFALPDIHTFYRFGISTGVAVSSLQNKTFGYAAGSTATKLSTRTTNDPRLVEPVLFLTYYPLHGGLDSEARGRWDDLGLVAGLSEKNPTSSFYVGLSTEPIRNISIIVGANATQVSVLDPSIYDAGPSAMHTSPTTRQAYRFGGFIAIAFNFSNFLQQVFK